MRFRIVKLSSFQPSTKHDRQRLRYHDPPLVKADSTKDGIPSGQIVAKRSQSHLLYEPAQLWSHEVIPLVLDKFSARLADTGLDSSIFATIPRIISHAQEGSPVYAVCNAIACAYLASTTSSAVAVVNRTRAYGAALRAVNAALADRAQCKNDSTLLAIWMFVVYEVRVIVHQRETIDQEG